jgi:hypothetical protein
VTAAPIKYDLPIANFIAGLDATGHVTHRNYTKKSVTFHHNGGRLSLAGILEVWKTRPASAHFQSDAAGRIGQYVGVYEYAWATGNTQGNIESISIEMADKTLAPDWIVDPVTWRAAARLAGWLFANVIKAIPTRNNVFVHHHWKSTDCAGPYIDRIFNDLLLEVQAWYKIFTTPKSPVTTGGTLEDIMALYDSAADFEAALTRATAKGTEQGMDAYVKRFLTNNSGTGDLYMDEVRAQRTKENSLLQQIANNTSKA